MSPLGPYRNVWDFIIVSLRENVYRFDDRRKLRSRCRCRLGPEGRSPTYEFKLAILHCQVLVVILSDVRNFAVDFDLGAPVAEYQFGRYEACSADARVEWPRCPNGRSDAGDVNELVPVVLTRCSSRVDVSKELDELALGNRFA